MGLWTFAREFFVARFTVMAGFYGLNFSLMYAFVMNVVHLYLFFNP